MKIEFRPDFRIDLKILWPKLKGAFKGLVFKPEDYERASRKAYVIIAWIVVAVVVLALAIAVIFGRPDSRPSR
jgi:hypothetical protein